jgi:hypothetical protein
MNIAITPGLSRKISGYFAYDAAGTSWKIRLESAMNWQNGKLTVW